jgi:hypothetical protein
MDMRRGTNGARAVSEPPTPLVGDRVADHAPHSLTMRAAVGLVAGGLVLATVANGAPSLLKRIGVLEPHLYETYWQVHCEDGGMTFRPLGLGRHCVDTAPGPLTPDQYLRDAPYFRFVYDVRTAELPFKLGKDIFLSIFALGSLALQSRGWRTPTGRDVWPLWGLCLQVAAATVVGFGSRQWLGTLIGLRTMSFLAVAVVGGWMTSAWSLRMISRAMVVLAFVELAVAPAELIWGIPISGYTIALSFPNRLAGTLVQPNTLGILAAVTVANAEAFEPDRAWRRGAWMAGLLLVAGAGSATGWIVLAAVALTYRGTWPPTPGRVAVVSATAVLLILALPTMVGRHDVYDSLVGTRGRLGALRETLAAKTVWTGEGLASVANGQEAQSPSIYSFAARPHGADATLISLLQTLGLLGAFLFYTAILLAWRRDPTVRPLLLALGLGSVTLNVTMAFPMSFLLGLVLARSFRDPLRAPRSAI